MRVALGAAAAIVVSVVALGAAVQILLARDLRDSLDSTLHQRAVEISQISATTPSLLKSPGLLDVSAGPRLVDVELVDRRRRIVARSLGLQNETLPADGLVADAVDRGRSGYATVHLRGGTFRIYASPLPDLGGSAGGGAVIVAASTDDVADTLEQSRRLIVGGALLAAMVAFPLSLLLARRALRPLERLSEDAALIERTEDPSLRLHTGDAPAADEVARLTDTLNRMLAALERAREAERRFIADASHELRNPLTALRGNAAYLAAHGGDGDALADLNADADRLSRLLDALLSLAREDVGGTPAEAVSLRELALAVAAEHGSVSVGADGPGMVRGDPGALERALRNLVENAVAYGPMGGHIRIDIQSEPDEIVLTVTDEGSGLPNELAAMATQRFWRGPNAASSQGSGLGLALVEATAERHGGTLVIDGPRFSIALPALMPLSEPAGKTAEAEPRRRP
jgi:signal transduction histidine kinase